MEISISGSSGGESLIWTFRKSRATHRRTQVYNKEDNDKRKQAQSTRFLAMTPEACCEECMPDLRLDGYHIPW